MLFGRVENKNEYIFCESTTRPDMNGIFGYCCRLTVERVVTAHGPCAFVGGYDDKVYVTHWDAPGLSSSRTKRSKPAIVSEEHDRSLRAETAGGHVVFLWLRATGLARFFWPRQVSVYFGCPGERYAISNHARALAA